jgi:hypothetical protein
MRAEAVIDADGHVLEPREAWKDLDVSIRPRIETDARGLDHVIVGDDDVFVAKLGQMGTPGSDVSTGSDSAFPGALDELRATIATLPAEGQARILSTNAATLYGL